MLYSRGYLFRCAGTGLARTGGAQHRHTGVQPDERHRPDARRGRGNAVHDRAGAERSETGGQRIHARGGARTAARSAVPARRTVLCKTARGPARRGRADARHDDDLPAHAVVLRAVLRDEQRAAGIHAQRRCADRCHVRHDRGQPVQHRVRLHFHFPVRTGHVRCGACDRLFAVCQHSGAADAPAEAVPRLPSRQNAAARQPCAEPVRARSVLAHR